MISFSPRENNELLRELEKGAESLKKDEPDGQKMRREYAFSAGFFLF